MYQRVIHLFSMFAIAATTFAYSGGPPDGRAGNPPANSTCVSCHSSFALNSGDGFLELLLPETYQPGQTYTITVNLADPGQSRWGFELTALNSENNQAGIFLVTDQENTQLSDNDGNSADYLKHTSSGTFRTQQQASWSFDWIAPVEESGEIVFYAAGNAANNNDFTSGDYIYAVSLPVPESESYVNSSNTAIPPAVFQISDVYPNPFNSQVRFDVSVPRNVNLKVKVVNTIGQTVSVIYDGSVNKGITSFEWDALGAAGIYFLVAETANEYAIPVQLLYVK